MGNKNKGRSINKIIRYIPILLILLSLTIMIGSTFAYFTDTKSKDSSLVFSKVELSSETMVGLNGVIKDAIPGSPMVDGPISFSKAIDSEAIYVRAKLSFSLPQEYASDEKMIMLLSVIKNSTDFGINTDVQNDAVWSQKQGDYFYLLDNSNKDNLKRVDDINTYVLSQSMVIPRNLEQLDDNYQYMKNINFNISFEAIQADNVSAALVDGKVIFDSIFPSSNAEKGAVIVTIMDENSSVKTIEILTEPKMIEQPTLDIPLDENGTSTKALAGWYTDSYFINEFNFNDKVTESVTLYPKLLDISQGLKFTGLTEVVSNGEYAINNAPDFTQNSASSDITSYSVAKGSCADAVVVIPEYYLGKPVTTISANGFYYNSNITNVILPNTINNIGTSAFNNCTKLELNKLPQSLKTIGSNSFMSTKINIEYIPNGVTSIGSGAFQSCSMLSKIYIPSTCTQIGTYVFRSCSNLVNIEIDDSNLIYNDGDGSNCIIESATNTLIIGCNNSTIPDNVKIISNYAFQYSTLGLIELPSNLQKIGESAFAYCSLLQLSKIPDTVDAIGSYAFQSCGSLGLLELSNNLTELSTSVFYGCSNLQIEKLPDGLKKINNQAFYNCTSLNLSILPDGLESIGSGAFNGCTNITTITIPENVTSISGSILLNSGILEYNYNAKKLTTSSSMGDIGTGSNEITVYIGENVLEIPANFASGASRVKNVIFKENSKCEKINNSAFSSSGIKTINIPSSVTSLGNSVFASSAIESIVLPDSVKSIGTYLFNYCKKLKSVEFSSYITTIPDNTFYYCQLLENVKLSDNITNIGSSAFYCCESLKSITFEENLIKVGQYAFYNCTKLEEINFNSISLTDISTQTYSDEWDWENDGNKYNYVFSSAGTKGNGIVVNIGSKVKSIPEFLFCPYLYVNDYGYSYYNPPKIIELNFTEDSSCTSIGQYAFFKCENLNTVTIPKGVKTIGTSAFTDCIITEFNFYAEEMNDLNGSTLFGSNYNYYEQVTEETKVLIGAEVKKIPANLLYWNNRNIVEVTFEENSVCTSIGNSAFYYTQIESINLPSTITSIGSSAFRGTKITSINLPEGLTSISTYAFANTNLESITLLDNITSIGTYAFYNCFNLKQINYNVTALSDLTTSSNVFTDVGKNAEECIVNIGANVTKIPAYLFYNNKNNIYVTKVVFEEGSLCASVGTYAFYNCPNLTDINLTDSLITIGAYAFYGCSSITSLTIHENIASLGSYSFYNAKNLTEINFNTTKISSVSSSSNIFTNAGALADVSVVKIGSKITSIPAYLFYNAAITQVVYEEDSLCTSIGNYAFANCSRLTNIELLEGLTSLGTNVFSNCTKVNVINYSANNLNTTNSLFGGVGKDSEELIVNIGASVTLIPQNLFSSSLITKIIFMEDSQCANIGNSAFSRCSKLQEIEIPANLTTLGSNVFYECTSLTNIKFNAVNMTDLTSSNNVFYKAGKDGTGINIMIDANVTRIPAYLLYFDVNVIGIEFEDDSKCITIGEKAFSACNGVTNINIPSSITTIGKDAFLSCTSLTRVDIKDINKWLSINFVSVGSNPLSSAKNLYVNNELIDEIVIPNDLNVLNNYVFTNCSNLKTLTLHNNITTIGAYALKGCVNLTNIVIPESVTTIGTYAFAGCTGITSITINENLTSMGDYAFADCLNLVEIKFNAINMPNPTSANYAFSKAGIEGSGINVIIGNKVARIPAYLFYAYYQYYPKIISVKFEENSVCTYSGMSAFYACSEIARVEVSTIEEWLNITFVNNASNPLYYSNALYIDDVLLTEFNFANCQSIGNYAFYNYSLLEKVILNGESSCVSIGEYAFYECSNLTSITIPDSVNTIGQYAFNKCTELVSINIPESLTTLNLRVFAGCAKLSEINFNATAMNDLSSYNYAFENSCQDGANIIIGANVTKIPAYLFGSYSKIKINRIEFKVGSVCESIGTSAFADVSNLSELIFNAVELNTVNSAFTSAGKNVDGVNVVIGKDVTKIPAGFLNSANLNTLTFEEGSICSEIGSNAFNNSYGLNDFDLPNTITIIGDNAFNNCKWLDDFNLPSAITTIGAGAFQYCVNLTNITIPSNVTSIGNNAFYQCIKLIEIVNLSTLNIIAGETTYGYVAYYALNVSTNGESKIETDSNGFVFFNGGENNIYLVNYVGSAKEIELPSDYQGFEYELYNDIFRGNNIITSVVIPNNITSISDQMFFGCENLVNIVIPDSITNIGLNALVGCSSLVSLTIPKNLTLIRKSVFSGLTSLQEIKYNAINATVEVDEEYYMESRNYVFYDAGLQSSGIQVVIGKDVTQIPSELFYPCEYQHYWIGEGEEQHDFTGMPNIISVEFEEGSVCNYIDVNAFYSLNNLIYFKIPATVTVLQPSFEYCDKLQFVLCDSNTFANKLKTQNTILNRKSIYGLQTSGYSNIEFNTIVTIGNITVNTAVYNGYNWVRTGNDTDGYKYYKSVLAV